MCVFGQVRITCVRLVQANDASGCGDERGLTQDDWTFFHFFFQVLTCVGEHLFEANRNFLCSSRLFGCFWTCWRLLRSLFHLFFDAFVFYFSLLSNIFRMGRARRTRRNNIESLFCIHSPYCMFFFIFEIEKEEEGNRNNNIKWYFIQMWLIRSSTTVSQLVSQNAWYVWLLVHFAGAPVVSAVAVVISKWIKFFIRSRCRCSSFSGSSNIFSWVFERNSCRFHFFLFQHSTESESKRVTAQDAKFWYAQQKIVIKKNWLAAERNWMRVFFHHQLLYYLL